MLRFQLPDFRKNFFSVCKAIFWNPLSLGLAAPVAAGGTSPRGEDEVQMAGCGYFPEALYGPLYAWLSLSLEKMPSRKSPQIFPAIADALIDQADISWAFLGCALKRQYKLLLSFHPINKYCSSASKFSLFASTSLISRSNVILGKAIPYF